MSDICYSNPSPHQPSYLAKLSIKQNLWSLILFPLWFSATYVRQDGQGALGVNKGQNTRFWNTTFHHRYIPYHSYIPYHNYIKSQLHSIFSFIPSQLNSISQLHSISQFHSITATFHLYFHSITTTFHITAKFHHCYIHYHINIPSQLNSICSYIPSQLHSTQLSTICSCIPFAATVNHSYIASLLHSV